MLSSIKRTLSLPADRYVIWIAFLLAAAGAAAVYSAIAFLAETKVGGEHERLLIRHMGRILLGLAVMGIFSVIDYKTLARFAKPALLVSIGLLLLVPVVGVVSGGAARWLRIGPFGFQPSDLAKVALLFYLSVLLIRKQGYIGDFSRAFVPVLVWTFATVALIGMENVSTAAILLATSLSVMFVARVRFSHMFSLAVLGLIGVFIMLSFSPARAARVEQWLGIEMFAHTEDQGVMDDQAEGYQSRQARIAFAMGGLTGVGPGKSVQRDFLPAPYNDFIYAIFAEEYGMIGAFFLLALFTALLFRGFLRIARLAPDPLGLLLGTGITTMLCLYGFIHAGVACGLLPVTGLPMPFVSYGGSAMLSAGMLLGILLNISRQRIEVAPNL